MFVLWNPGTLGFLPYREEGKRGKEAKQQQGNDGEHPEVVLCAMSLLRTWGSHCTEGTLGLSPSQLAENFLGDTFISLKKNANATLDLIPKLPVVKLAIFVTGCFVFNTALACGNRTSEALAITSLNACKKLTLLNFCVLNCCSSFEARPLDLGTHELGHPPTHFERQQA